MEEDFLANVPKEGADPFADFEKDTQSDPPPEKEPETGEPAQGDSTEEKPLPFHEHPRWKERETELKELREQRDADARAIAELKDRIKPSDVEIPEKFVKLYGDNPDAYKAYREFENERKELIKQELQQELEQKAQKEQEQAAHWTKWVDEQIADLKAEGKTFDENELKKTMVDFKPTDGNGNLDFKAGFRIYEALHKDDGARSRARKELADTTTRATPGEKKVKDYMTPNDLRHRSWGSL